MSKEIKQPEKFTFWYPAELVKAKDKKGNKIMRMGGIASTMDKDSDGEFLDPSGFDLAPFLEKGTINWHHQTKNSPSAIVGEPSTAKITKQGLYLEADLYPSSKVAQQVFETAETLEKDSKTRRLGFSIEGSVIERGSEDKTHPDYYVVKKATITGCAITHMPKNPKTFANIIKGQLDDEDDQLEKSVEYTIVEGTEEEMIEKINSHYPGINLEKAKQINLIFNKIKLEMKKGKSITDDSISKALDNLGLTAEIDTDLIVEKAASTEDEVEETATKKKPLKKVIEKAKEEEEEEEEEGDKKKPAKKVEKAKEEKEEEEEEEKKPVVKKEIKKAKSVEIEKAKTDLEVEDETEVEIEKAEKKLSAFDRIEKAISDSSASTNGLVRSLARLVKTNMDDLELIKGELTETKDELKKANDTIQEMATATPVRKSVTNVRDRNFEKSEQEEQLEKYKGKTVISKADRSRVLDVLDRCTFEKGMDEDFAKAMTNFEGTGQISESVLNRLAIEKNIIIK